MWPHRSILHESGSTVKWIDARWRGGSGVERRRDGLRYYLFPGGGVEPGETAEEAGIREAAEELGLLRYNDQPIYDIVGLEGGYPYGGMGISKTTVEVNDQKVQQVKAALGTRTLKDTVDAAFDAVLSGIARQRLIGRLRQMDGLDLDDPAVMERAWR